MRDCGIWIKSLGTNHVGQIRTLENVLKQDFASDYILIKLFEKTAIFQ